MTKEEKLEAFARAWADPKSPTFQNAAASYRLFWPDASDVSARRSASRLMNDGRVQQIIAEFREASKTFGSLSLDEYVRRGWEVFNALADRAMRGESDYANSLPRLFEAVGKGAGFQIKKVEDVTPVERKFPPAMNAESIAAAREALDRMERLNEPNPMPRVTATARVVIEDAEVISDDSNTEDAETVSSASASG